MTRTQLYGKLAGGVLFSCALFGGLLFLFAWRLDWWRAWVFLAVVFVASAWTMLGVFASRPELLAERYKPPVQKGQPFADKILTPLIVITFDGLVAFIPVDVFHLRLLGSPPLAVSIAGLALFAAGWAILALAMRENAFTAPIVKHQQERGQVVVKTGPYRFVRHPMYGGAIPVAVGMALWLGSYAAAALALVPILVLAARVRVEEEMLRKELAGYEEYAREVRWRMVPGVW